MIEIVHLYNQLQYKTIPSWSVFYMQVFSFTEKTQNNVIAE